MADLSKIRIGGADYSLKDAEARAQLNLLLEDAAKHMKTTGIFADDAAVKSYVDGQVGAINKFDVAVATELPVASKETMYILYLVADKAEAGTYIEWITIRSGEEDNYTYNWEQIGSTAVSLDGYITGEGLVKVLEDYEKIENLGELAYKDSATGNVAGQTISGVKATGTSTGSITVELDKQEKEVASTGKYTPAGSVSGTVTIPEHNVPVILNGNEVAATIKTGTGSSQAAVTITDAKGVASKNISAGTQALFTEGEFTPATLGYEAVEKSYAEAGLIGEVQEETLIFTAAAISAIAASKINTFDGGSKAKDTFVANSLPTFEEVNVVTGITDAIATVEYEKVTGVDYYKTESATATCAGDTVDINAVFAGTEGDVNVAGNCHEYSVKTAEFNGASIELSVDDIVVTEKEVTVQ